MNTRNVVTYILSSFLIISVFTFSVPQTNAETACVFTRHLDLDIEGEDVRCLQKFLNNTGYVISQSGVGSPGRETNQYKNLTQAAVIKWQKDNNLYPPIGYFGDQSISQYKKLTATTQKVKTSDQTAELLSQVEALQKKLVVSQSVSSSVKTSSPSSDEKKYRSEFKKVVDMIEDAEDEKSDGNYDSDQKSSIVDDIDDAKEALFDSVVSFFKNNFDNALDDLYEALDDAEDAFEDAGGQTEEDKIDDFIEDLEDEIDDAEDEIEEAEDDGDDVDDAEEYLEEAEDALERAEEEYDDKDYNNAIKYAKKAQDYAEEAEDEL